MPQFTNILESVQDAVNWISFRGRKRKILVPKDQNEDEEMDFKVCFFSSSRFFYLY